MSKKTGWFWGIFLVLAAAVIIASQVVGLVQIGFWSLLATVLLLAVLISSLLSLAFPGVTLSLGLLYLMYQPQMGWYPINGWILMLAALIGGIGLSIIVRPLRRKKHRPKITIDTNRPPVPPVPPTPPPAPDAPDAPPPPPVYEADQSGGGVVYVENDGDENIAYAKVSMGAVSRYLRASAFQSGEFYVSMGSLDVYFDQVTLHPDGAQVYVECSVGSINLYIPRHWRVENHVRASIGAVEIEERIGAPQSGPVLRLTGRVSVGGMEIKYI